MPIDYPFANTTKTTWDTLILGPYVFPGRCTLTINISYSYDVGKPQGTEKAHVTYKGMNPRKLNATITIYSKEQFDDFVENVVPNLAARANSQKVHPFVIDHPQAHIWGVREVVIENITPDAPNASDGWNIGLTLLEYSPKPKPSKRSKRPKKRTDDKNNSGKARSFPPNGPDEDRIL